MVDLQSLLDPNDPLRPQIVGFSGTARINGRGQILIGGADLGSQSMLLTPLPAVPQ